MTNHPLPGSGADAVPSSIPKPAISKATTPTPRLPKWKGRRTICGNSSLRLARQRSETARRPQPAPTVFGEKPGGPGIGTQDLLRFGRLRVQSACLGVSRRASQIFGEKPLAAWGGSQGFLLGSGGWGLLGAHDHGLPVDPGGCDRFPRSKGLALTCQLKAFHPKCYNSALETSWH
jgi:hypothetical protein